MQNLYWIGARESDVNKESVFSGSITRYGTNIKKNISLLKSRQSLADGEYISFISDTLYELAKQDKQCHFLFSNSNTAYKMPANIIERCICLNPFPLVTALNDKFFVRQFLLGACHMPPYIIVNGKLLQDANFINKIFNKKYDTFVGQKSVGGGGRKTFLLNNPGTTINEDEDYIVTPYFKKNIPVNVHCIIYADDIIVLPPSIQLIINDFKYIGADFFTSKIISFDEKIKLYNYSFDICKRFQKLGALGILGLDYILVDGDFLFLESNFRVQGSSFLLNMGLNRLGISLYESHIKSFSQPKCDISKDVFFKDINLSFVKEINNQPLSITINPIKVNLDGYTNDLLLSEHAYMYNSIYDKPIFNCFQA
ncbi:MAG: ATP-grasp domain-containing protein [Malacoplasma sp.]|nr:ATP-grasp domain-containing protein [Malacoplasma sp.]